MSVLGWGRARLPTGARLKTCDGWPRLRARGGRFDYVASCASWVRFMGPSPPRVPSSERDRKHNVLPFEARLGGKGDMHPEIKCTIWYGTLAAGPSFPLLINTRECAMMTSRNRQLSGLLPCDAIKWEGSATKRLSPRRMDNQNKRTSTKQAKIKGLRRDDDLTLFKRTRRPEIRSWLCFRSCLVA